MEDYHFSEEVGSGKGAVVYKGRKRGTLEFVAIKSVEKAKKAEIQGAVHIMHHLKHANVLKFYTWYETRNHIWVITEFCTGGTLLRLLKQDERLPEESIQAFGVDLMSGLQYCHSKEVIVCDLKPSNILLDENGVLKLADFVLAQRFPTDMEASQAMRGTPNYMAPELFQDGVYSIASDLWSFGCVLYQFAVGAAPFIGGPITEMPEKIRGRPARPPADIARSWSPEFRSLLALLLQKDPLRRPTWKELLEHPFWKGAPGDLPTPLTIPEQPAFEQYIRSRKPDMSFPEAILLPAPGSVPSTARPPKLPTPAELDPGGQAVVNILQMRSSRPEDSLAEGEEDSLASGEDGGEEEEEEEEEEEGEAGSRRERPVTADTSRSGPILEAKQQGEAPIAGPVEPSMSLLQILYHPADRNVLPILFSPEAEPHFRSPTYKAELMKMKAYSPEDVLRLPYKDLLKLLSNVCRCFSTKSTSMGSKMSLLGYLWSLASTPKLANEIVNGKVLDSLVGQLKKAAARAAKSEGPGLSTAHKYAVRILSVLGFVIRSATLISCDRISEELLTLLGQLCIRNKDLLRARAVGVLGELMFYISTVEPPKGDAEGKDGGEEKEAGWTVSAATVNRLVRCLTVPTSAIGGLSPSDVSSIVYSCQTVLNILCKGKPEFSQRFATRPIMEKLLRLVSTSPQGPLAGTRTTACRAISMMMRYQPSLSETVASEVPASQLAKWLVESGAEFQQSVLQLLATALLIYSEWDTFFPGVKRGEKLATFFQQVFSLSSLVRSLLPTVARLYSGISYPKSVRSKAGLCLRLALETMLPDGDAQSKALIKCAGAMIRLCEKRLLGTVDKVFGLVRNPPPLQSSTIAQMPDEWLVAASASLLEVLARVGMLVLHRTVAAVEGRDPKDVEDVVRLWPSVLHLLRSPNGAASLLSGDAMEIVALLLHYCGEAIGSSELEGRSFEQGILSPLLSCLPGLVHVLASSSSRESLFFGVLPAVVDILGSSDGDIRLLGLTSLDDVMKSLWQAKYLFEEYPRCLDAIESLLTTNLLPRMAIFCDSGHSPAPFPLKTLRILLVGLRILHHFKRDQSLWTNLVSMANVASLCCRVVGEELLGVVRSLAEFDGTRVDASAIKAQTGGLSFLRLGFQWAVSLLEKGTGDDALVLVSKWVSAIDRGGMLAQLRQWKEASRVGAGTAVLVEAFLAIVSPLLCEIVPALINGLEKSGDLEPSEASLSSSFSNSGSGRGGDRPMSGRITARALCRKCCVLLERVLVDLRAVVTSQGDASCDSSDLSGIQLTGRVEKEGEEAMMRELFSKLQQGLRKMRSTSINLWGSVPALAKELLSLARDR